MKKQIKECDHKCNWKISSNGDSVCGRCGQKNTKPNDIISTDDIESRKITKEQADKLMSDKNNKANERVICTFEDSYYDVRGMTDEDFRLFCEKLTGKKINPNKNIGTFSFGECTVICNVENNFWHMTISHPTRSPTCFEIKEARFRFIPNSIRMAMLFPGPNEELLDMQPNCYHLWQLLNI